MAAQGLPALPAWARHHPQLLALRYYEGITGGAGLKAGEEARRAYLLALARNVRALAERDALLEAAARAGLPVLVAKGGHLADALYPDPALRPMTDLDLYAPRRALEGLGAMLRERGYRAHVYPERVRLGLEHHVHYRRPADGLCVELHWALWHELGLDGSLGGLFARARRGGGGHLWPSLEDELTIALLHAAAHAFDLGPAWLFDVALLLGHAELNVGLAAEEAARRGGQTAFEVGAALARVAFPDEAAVQARLPAPRSARARLLVARLAPPLLGGRPLSRRAAWLVKATLFDEPCALAAALLTKARVTMAERSWAAGPTPC